MEERGTRRVSLREWLCRWMDRPAMDNPSARPEFGHRNIILNNGFAGFKLLTVSVPELYVSRGERLLAGTVAEDPAALQGCFFPSAPRFVPGWQQGSEVEMGVPGGRDRPPPQPRWWGDGASGGRYLFASGGVAGGSCRRCASWRWRQCSLPDFLTEGVKDRG